MQYLAHPHAWREHGTVTTGHHIVAQLEVGVAWHFLHICKLARTALPSQIAEVSPALDGTADVRLHVEHRYHDRVVLTHEIYDAHYAGSAYHTHVLVDAVSATFVDGHEVARLVETVVHHLGRYQPVALQEGELVAMVDGAVLGDAHERVGQLVYLLLQISVTLGEFLVHLGQ